MGGKWRLLSKIFANPDLPEIDDYYEPFTFDYDHLQQAKESQAFPTARPRSLITGERMEKSTGARTGKKSWAANFPSGRKTIISKACKRKFTASSKIPS
jgi:nitrate reductase beta subunit